MSSSDMFVDDLRESRDRALAEVERLKAEIGALRAAVANQAEALERERRMGKTVITSMKVTNNGIIGNEIGTIPMLIFCPICGRRHIDVGEFETKPHHTHACQHCGHAWRPAIVPTVGVAFLPGFKDITEMKGSTAFPFRETSAQETPRHAEQTMEMQRRYIGQLIDRIPVAEKLAKEVLVEAIESAFRRTAASDPLGTNKEFDDFIHHATSNAVQTIMLHIASTPERDAAQKKRNDEFAASSSLNRCSECGVVVVDGCHTCEPHGDSK